MQVAVTCFFVPKTAIAETATDLVKCPGKELVWRWANALPNRWVLPDPFSATVDAPECFKSISTLLSAPLVERKHMPSTPVRSQNPPTLVKESHPSGDNRFKVIDRTLKRFQYQHDALIEVLHTAQETFGFLSDDLLIYVARQLKLPLSWVYGVATFYHFFSLKPQGEHNCTICLGTACYVKNAAELIAVMRQAYGIEPGQMTRDHQLSLATARCFGSCGLAPVVLLDGNVMGRAQPETLLAQVHSVLNAAPQQNGAGEAESTPLVGAHQNEEPT